MKRPNFVKFIVLLMSAILMLSVGPAFAAKGGAASPDLAAKREMVRKQQEQRITHDKRQAGAAALKAERIRIYNAKQAAKGKAPYNKNK